MRLHALIFASRAGVPMLALAYARKMRGAMRLLRAERWVVEVESRTPPAEELEMKLRLLWHRRSEEGARVREASGRARARAQADAAHIAAIIKRAD
jgi:polysaccharide pyruvyl transferase WcaK-like protein